MCHRGCPVADISLQIPGVHNVLNSLALHLNNFKGVSRRFEMIGRVRGCHICDDYAHHPTEVRAVLQAARQRFQYEDLLVVFQPHTYSRLAALKNEFANAFSDADVVVVTEIYGARETNLWKISGRDLATSIMGPSSEYIPSLGDVVDKLARYISKDPGRKNCHLNTWSRRYYYCGPKTAPDTATKVTELICSSYPCCF
ncbi:UDP-N-acetylmuramate--L-alanine ligase [Camellia lanceoleosa]|uniref:UDP-N-acetylmuramate--L-alanine ligase n=1 Tax=Camellia lanceoleosa TaxID=1840588 RepID=A0ACC0IWF9_9ERIC|nr:UDP-N-acetylmuramate--L-alanine ligase [Camellia lanceoleosa]